MHISLDSALGRQRRLNSVGESITQIAPDPAAAYSLRSLTGGDPKVVRVRRGSDNHEQDFTASDVSSGALQDFVNAQVVAPLDIQALSATGRDGDFLIAKAAYSLRSLGTRQATVAATGDTVARANGQFVCQVRRPSDDALKSFTAAEVTDGTLLSFVTEEVTLLDATDFSSSLPSPLSTYSDGSLTSTFGQSIGGSDNTYLLERNSESTNGVLIRYLGTPNIFAGDTVTLTVEVFLPTSNTSTGISFSISNLSSGNVHNIQITKGSWQTVTITGTMNSNAITNNFRIQSWIDGSNNKVGAVGEKLYIRKYELKVKSSDGFVKTWYDQSVTTQAGDTATGNHATQATAANQPKIVSAGALNTNGGLLFDGTNDKLGFTALDDANVAMFSVLRFNDVSGTKQVLGSSIGDGTFGIDAEDVYKYSDNSGSEDGDLNATITTSADFLYSGLKSGSGNTISFFTNGTASEVKTITGSVESDTIGGPTNHLSANLKEIVIYTTDQSDNRTAIEANIGEAYSIDLPSGVDPGFDQVDGFVETWYDQSGNGNNATQATAGSQPKIVNAGSYLGLVRTDGVDDFFDLTTQIDFNSSHGVFAVYADAGGNRFSLIGRPASTGGMGYNNASASSTGVGIMHINGAQQNQSISGIDKTQQNTLYILWQPDSASAIYGVSGSEVTRTFTSDGGNANFTDDVSIPITVIGKDNDAISQQDFKEIIIYATDQTSKRTTLEANMAAAHGITLS